MNCAFTNKIKWGYNACKAKMYTQEATWIALMQPKRKASFTNVTAERDLSPKVGMWTGSTITQPKEQPALPMQKQMELHLLNHLRQKNLSLYSLKMLIHGMWWGYICCTSTIAWYISILKIVRSNVIVPSILFNIQYI